MENTFTKKITFTSFVPDTSGQEMVEQETTKTATFIELNRKDQRQEKLFWRIISLYQASEIEKGDEESEDIKRIEPSTDKISELTNKAIRTLLIVDENFTEEDKKDFLSDSIAKINFGLWFLNVKAQPFFLKIQPG